MNPVISRKYVEENYIKKSELKQFIDFELRNHRLFGDLSPQLEGKRKAYETIIKVFWEESNEK